MNWLDRGTQIAELSPLYDNERFDVKTDIVDAAKAHTTLVRGNGVVSANAEVALPDQLPPTPLLRKDN